MLWIMRRSTEPADIDPERLRAARIDANLSGADLARKAGLDRRNYYAIEAGRRGVSFDTLVDIADALQLDPVELTPADAPTTLATLRLRKRMSRTTLADHIGVSHALIWKIETGSRPITDDVAQHVAGALDVDVESVQAAVQASTQNR